TPVTPSKWAVDLIDGTTLAEVAVDSGSVVPDEFGPSGTIAIEVSVAESNGGRDTFYSSSGDFELQDSNGTVYASTYVSGADQQLSGVQLPVGGNNVGYISFEVPPPEQ